MSEQNEQEIMQPMKTCKYCKSEIPADAKICPNCRKKTKSKKLKWIILGIIALLIVLIIAFSGDEETSKKVGEVGDNGTSAAATDSDGTAENVKTTYAVGDILQDGNLKIVYIASGEYTSDNKYSQPNDGNKFIFLKFAFENTGTSGDEGVTSWDFECYADGYAVEEYYGGEDDLSATLSPGRATTGYVYFEVPEAAKEIEIEYETNFFTSEKIYFVYEGDKDSGYEISEKTEATANAYKVGDIVEGNFLKITYLSCENYESDNMFVEPKDGYHFVSLEFEFENLSSDDEVVTSSDFYGYADGIACDKTYIRDDDLSATLSTGRKTTGTVTFEVPDDATTIEAEFESNIWTDSRIVFTIK